MPVSLQRLLRTILLPIQFDFLIYLLQGVVAELSGIRQTRLRYNFRFDEVRKDFKK